MEVATFFNACKSGNLQALKSFIANNPNFDVNIRHRLGWTALHVAAVNGNASVVEYLLKLGVDVNSIDYFNWKYSDDLYKMDIRRHEFCYILRPSMDFEGFTALHYAVLSNNLETVKILANAGANPNLINNLKHKAIGYAKEDNLAMIHFLKEYTESFAKLESKRQLEERRRFPLEQRLKQRLVG